MADRLKSILALDTVIVLLFAIWTARYQMKTIAFTLVIGIVGTLLIFATEFLYSYRKAGVIKIGRVRTWLRAHIVGGIAGPLIILWHTGLNFNGLAGWVALLTATVVVSGLTGRYIYRHIPRSLKGQALTLSELEAQMQEIESQLLELVDQSPEVAELVTRIRSKFGRLGKKEDSERRGPRFLLWMILATDWQLGRLRTRWLMSKKFPIENRLLGVLEELEFRRLVLTRRIRMLDTSKAMLAKWRVLHIPLTLALFTGIMIHVVSILYYGKVWP